MYHFLSGFTSKVAGTELGVTEPQPTFSTCFGAPFMPRRPEIYGNLLKAKIASSDSKCWLVNTGWTGGPYGEGQRMPIQATRTLLAAALTGEILKGEFRKDENFGFEVPIFVDGVNSELLDPRKTWQNSEEYDVQARKLIDMFVANFEQYMDHVDNSIKGIVLK
jgi:phosphoenolpyruvate carboxykinase (ATP)